MPYIEEVCKAGRVIEVQKYYSFRCHGKGIKRSPNKDATSLAMKKINQRRAGTKLRRLMNANFEDGDLLLRLDFHKTFPKDSQEMQNLIATSLRRLKRIYEKEGKPFKYIYVKEVGPKGGRHVHMLIKRIDLETLRLWWKHGGIHADPLNTEGQYGKIAEYFIKYANRTEETEGKLIGKRWYSSQNLIQPVIKKRVIMAHQFKPKVRLKKGYELDKSSVRQGISEITGYEYFFYSLICRGNTDDS